MSDDYADMLGLPSEQPAPAKRGPGRPRIVEATGEDDPALALMEGGQMPDEGAFHRPVSRTFLATVLGKEPRRLAKQLANCPVVGYQRTPRGNIPLYDFKEAIGYCVTPKIDMVQWIKTQSMATLPPLINKAFWDSMRSRQMVEERAKDLWRTADVLEVLGRTALTIKETAQLWLENMPDKDSLSSEQHEFLRRQVSGLLDDIHQRLVEMPKQFKTRASISDVEKIVEEMSTFPDED